MKKLIKIIIIFLQIFLNFTLLTSKDCFEYSCEKCINSEYGSCTKCKENFILMDGTCPCYDYACNVCDTSYVGSRCYFCDENFQLNEQNQCVCEDPNCEICEKNGCLKCRSGYNISSNLCTKNENDQNNCLDENCNQCLNTVEKYTCTKCNKGYELVMGKCEELKKIKYFYCEDSDYYPSFDGYCYPKCGGAKCENYIYYNYKECLNKCLLCKNNDLYIIIDCENESSIENCSVQKNNNECAVCNVGYYKIRGQCEKCQKGCKKCSDKYTCFYCDHNYNLLNNGTCEEITKNSDKEIQEKFSEFKNQYLTAKNNYYQLKNINENQTNITIEDKCEVQHCSVCSKLVNNYCLLCDLDYENINGECYAKNCKIKNCEECEEKDVCSYCEDGYYLENNSCKMTCDIENCETCSTPFYCDKCKKGYEFNGIECKLKCSISNCLECNIFDKCNKCNNGYYLKSNGYCSKCKTDNCKICSVYNNIETCHICDNDFYLENDKCSKICTIKNCEYCLRNENVCAKCKKNCKLKGDKCSCKNIGLIVGLVITFSILISVVIIIVVIYKKRMNEREQRNNVIEIEIDNRINNENNRINNNNNYRNIIENNQNNNSNNLENNYPYIDNEKNNINNQRKSSNQSNNNLCEYCHLKKGIEKKNCGCFLCEEHNKPKEIISKDDKILQCIKCGYISKDIEECKICFEYKRLKHFKCGCNGKVCNECYEKILKDKKNCPFCRKNIR